MNAPFNKHPQITSTRPLTRADLVALEKPRAPGSRIKVIRELHHKLAKLFAVGHTNQEVYQITGASLPRLRNFLADPAFQQLIAEYRGSITKADIAKYDHVTSTAHGVLKWAVDMLADEYEEAMDSGERIPLQRNMIVIRELADRFGYGKHTTQTTNHLFATEMEQAVIRSNQAKLIEGSASPSLPQSLKEPPSPPEPPKPAASSSGFRHRV